MYGSSGIKGFFIVIKNEAPDYLRPKYSALAFWVGNYDWIRRGNLMSEFDYVWASPEIPTTTQQFLKKPCGGMVWRTPRLNKQTSNETKRKSKQSSRRTFGNLHHM